MRDDEPYPRALGRVGTTLKGKYRLEALIGVGGMAAVYRAQHRNRAQLAVKVLHPELSLRADLCARFLREGYAANSVKHPGVVLVVDDDVADDGAAFLVMELLEGETAEHLAAGFGGKLPASIAVAIAHQLLDVLSAAHAAGVVHRDIKPANLFLTRDGTVKVLDFGIARVLEAADAGALATGSGVPIGTPAFMAPEQALARSREIDARTDVWAAGATLFTLLGGETVHPTPTSAEALVNAATRAARSLASAAPDVPAPLVLVVDKALAFERDARWQSASEMEEALVHAFVEISGAPPSKATLAGLFPQRASMRPPPAPDDPRRSGSHPGGAPLPELASAPTLAAPELPSAGSAATRSARAGRRLGAVWATVGLAVVLAGTLGVLRLKGRRATTETEARAPAWAPSPGSAPLVLVFGFDNRTSDPTLDGTVDLVLAGALKRSPTLYPLAGTTLRGLIAEEVPEAAGEDALIGRLVAEKERRPVAVVHGFVAQEGAGFSITVTANDGETGARIAEATAQAKGVDEVARTAADLACGLRSSLHDSPCDEASRGKSGLSESMEANHEFVVGRAAFNTGNNADAEPHFRRAVAIDPGFSMAQLSLGLLLWNTGKAELGLPHLDAALAQKDQLSEREKVVVRATELVMKDDFGEAARAYEEQLARWPADTWPRGNLASTLFGAGRIEDALAQARRNLAEHPRNVIVWGELAELHVVSSDLEDAAREAHMVVANFSKPPSVTHAAGGAAEVLLGRRSAALDLYARLATTDPETRAALEADLAMYEGRLTDARATLEKSLATLEANQATSEAQAVSATLAEALLRHGDLDRARERATRAAGSGDLVTLVRAGLVLARGGHPGEAEGVVKSILSHTGERAPVFARMVRAESFLARHAPKEALAALGEIGTGPGSPLAHAIHGEAELDLGALEDAEQELQAALAHRGALAFAFYDEISTLRYVPEVAYSLARAKDLLHRPDAAEAYRALLAMEPAAQGDPWVVEATRRAGAP